MNPVKVIDAICGAGKSTYIFEMMRKNPREKWLFVSPYLSEVGDGGTKGRIQETLPEMNFKSPKKSGGKGKDFKRLLTQGENIALTHALLINADIECAEIVKQQGYNIVVDETIDAISKFDGIASDDVPMLIDNYVVVEKIANSPNVGKLSWNYTKIGDNYAGDRLDIKRLCDLESLYLFKNNVLINKLSPAMLKAAKQTYILTYMFEPSMMCQWFKILGIEYEYMEIGFKGITPEQIKGSVRKNLVIVRTPNRIMDMQRNSHGELSLSCFNVSWYKRAHRSQIEGIKKSCENVVKNIFPSRPKVFWTVFKDYREDIKGERYTRGWAEGVDSFVSKTKRASNEYADANCCLYLVNVYPHGDISSFVKSFDIDLDEEAYAISEMVQFIFRGSIRKGEKMYLMVASERMRMLLLKWLEGPK